MSKQINLFAPALLKQKAVFTAATMAQSLGLIMVGIAALIAYGRHSVAEREREAASGEIALAQRHVRQNAVQLEFAARFKQRELEQDLVDAEAQLRALRQVGTVVERGEFGNTTGYAEYFRALARQSAGSVWLTGVSINGPGRQIGLQGRALEPTLVPAYISRLTHEPVMRGKSFGSLQISRASTKDKDAVTLAPYVDFSLQAELVNAPTEGAK
jgi:Tfp pilus assembly protein PilN